MDKATVLGLLIGFGGILFGNYIEGAHMGSLVQTTALIIVLAGTTGAVLVSHSLRDVSKAMQMAREAFKDNSHDEYNRALEQIVDLAKVAKKEGVLILETHLNKVHNEFLRRVLRTVIDGIQPQMIREIFEAELEIEEEKLMVSAKVWSDAGGFSPTIGIIGAVLGLIHVMSNLTDTSKLGSGIAVAFVATVYGVGSANLLFLPLGNKIKRRVQEHIQKKMAILDSALLVGADLNTLVVDQKVKSHRLEISQVEIL
ncbi:MAG: flagellar motor protein [Bdellovibrionota bacterium]